MSRIVFLISAVGAYIILSIQLGRAGGLLEIFLSLFLASLFYVSRTRLRREAKQTQKERKKGKGKK